MNIFKRAWKEAYVPSDEQQRLIERLYENSDDDTRGAMEQAMIHMYAEGWKDYALPFMGIGVCLGLVIGKIVRK